jgi:thiol-disulfide isomerase/thioredoxin
MKVLKRVVLFLFCCPVLIGFTQSFFGTLDLGENKLLCIQLNKRQNRFYMVNGLEVIPLEKKPVPNCDSIDLVFPYFHSYFRCKETRGNLKGYWNNVHKLNYKIPMHLSKRKKEKKTNADPLVAGKWSVTFSKQNNPYPAIGQFEIINNRVYGTFMTETGDYRFLNGFTKKDSLFLFCMDGSHAFYFAAKYNYQEMRGVFMSGTHYKTDWTAIRDDNATLNNPYTLTELNDSQTLSFTFPDLNGNYYTFPNHLSKNKVTIITLMGTWCPNCIDEALFLKALHEKYDKTQVKIIAVCYEASDDLKKQVENVKKLNEIHGFDFTFLVAGKASKLLAHQHFPLLSRVMSFPTTIFVDKQNKVRKIFTGFYGPATKTYYEKFKSDTYSLLDTLIQE